MECGKCGTTEDVHECWACDKQKCIDCDSDEMRSDTDGHTYCSDCGPKDKKASFNQAIDIGWSVLKDEKPYPDDDMWSIVDQNLQIGGLDDYNRQQEPYYRQQIADQQIEELMSQMPRPHSNRVDCANCNNYPMSKVARPATGGVEPYYMGHRCGNSVRVM